MSRDDGLGVHIQLSDLVYKRIITKVFDFDVLSTCWRMLVAKQLVSWVSITSNLLAFWGLARLPVDTCRPVMIILIQHYYLLQPNFNLLMYIYIYMTTTIFVAPSCSQNIQPWINFGSIRRHLESMTTEYRNAAQRRHFETQTHFFLIQYRKKPFTAD